MQLGKLLPHCKTGKRCIQITYGDDAAFEEVKKHVKKFLEMILEK